MAGGIVYRKWLFFPGQKLAGLDGESEREKR